MVFTRKPISKTLNYKAKAEQEFNTGDTGPVLGLRQDYKFKQNIIGAKVKIIGDAVYDQDSFMPQISVGAQYKKASDAQLLTALGAKDDDGLDLYASATKILLDNLQIEGSAAYMLSKRLVIGADYRTKPNNLSFAKEQDAKSAYLAYFPSKHISLTSAYVDIGEVALQGNQSGFYGSVQVGF